MPQASASSALGGIVLQDGAGTPVSIDLGLPDNGFYGFFDPLLSGWTFSCAGTAAGGDGPSVCFVYTGNGPYGERCQIGAAAGRCS